MTRPAHRHRGTPMNSARPASPRCQRRNHGRWHVRDTGLGRYAQGRVRADRGRRAEGAGGARPVLPRVGDLPPGRPPRPTPTGSGRRPSSGWFGQQIHRSDDGGRSWQPMGNEFAYTGVPGTHQWYDGTPHPWEFARVWHLSLRRRPGHRLAGVEDAALFRSVDGGRSWTELPGCAKTAPARTGNRVPGTCLHTILPDPRDPGRMHVAISAAGVFRTDDAGKSWRATNRRLIARAFRTRRPKPGTAYTISPSPGPARTPTCRSTGT